MATTAPFTIHAEPGGTLHVRSADDVEGFNELLDRYEHNLLALNIALVAYLNDHPRHIDALAHLTMIDDGLGDDAGRVTRARAALEVLTAGLDASEVRGALDHHWLENRPVLRLVRNATLAAWAAADWELTDTLAETLAVLDPEVRSADWADDIAARRNLAELRG